MMQVAINRIGAIAPKIWLGLLIYLTVIFLNTSKAISSEVEAVSAEKNQNQFCPILTIDELKKTRVVKLAGIIVPPTGQDKQQENGETCVVQLVYADAS